MEIYSCSHPSRLWAHVDATRQRTGLGDRGYCWRRFSVAGAELYDPATETWIATTALSRNRAGHSATLLPNGKVLIAGGFDGPHYDWRNTLDTADLFDYSAASPGSTKAAMTSPVPGSTLTSSTVTFRWNTGTGVSQYWLSIGSDTRRKPVLRLIPGNKPVGNGFRSANQREHALCEALVADQRRVAIE